MKTVLSYGMGVESTAILLRWIREPETCPCPLNELLVITAQTGEEWRDTGVDVEAHILPLMRAHGIRFVQVARHGHTEADGITVLDDSAAPTKVYLDGDYKLSTELVTIGTVPTYSGEHKCALKFKAWVIEEWMRQYLPADAAPFLHAFGYNVDEQSRVKKSQKAIAKRRIAFGYNVDERSRVSRSKKYDSADRVGFYPLLDWGWSRADCIDYIREALGVTWRKSACAFCPFACNKQAAAELAVRQAEQPEQVAAALELEYVAMAMNPRGTLYRGTSLHKLVVASANFAALQALNARLAARRWGVYRVRRIYTGPGKAHRCVERMMAFGSREAALAALPPGAVDQAAGHAYVYRARRLGKGAGREEFYTVAPAYVIDKARYGVPKFDLQWAAAPAAGKKAA